MDLVASSADLASDILQEQFGAVLLDSRLLIGKLGVLNPPPALKQILDDAQRVLPLVSEIASAKSSADVSAALQAAAAPADSYRAKYQRNVVALGGLVGGFGGWERPNQPHDKALFGSSQTSGVVAGFAPVGLQASTPFCNQLFYFEAMLSVIDLGALTTQRFESQVSDSTAVTTSTNVTFGQVFSPGAYGMFGLGGSPLVLGFGASLAPSLRTVETTLPAGGTVKEDLSTLRVGGFLAMDITILPL
jgi:hypothetical protein